MTEYRQLAQAAMAKACGFDPYFPERSDVMVSAWAEALEHGGITELEDVLMAVRVMFMQNGDPGWHPTPRVLVTTARECKKLRQEREEKNRPAIEEAPKRTFREFRERHPEVVFPKVGKDVPQ
jgi:hypothetical protein